MDWVGASGGFESTEECTYRAGELVDQTGIYEVCHTDEQRQTVVLVRAQFFPECVCCGIEVRYRLLQAAPHVYEDEDFRPEEPETGTKQPVQPRVVKN
jgi:hypothetical protein